MPIKDEAARKAYHKEYHENGMKPIKKNASNKYQTMTNLSLKSGTKQKVVNTILKNDITLPNKSMKLS
jgi:hypothetical protein